MQILSKSSISLRPPFSFPKSKSFRGSARYQIVEEEYKRTYQSKPTVDHRYLRASITSQIDHSSKQAESIRTCELDGLTVLDLACTNSSLLFSVLKQAGIDSKLISHFARCESLGQRYTSFSNRRVLFNRDLCQEKQVNPERQELAPSSKYSGLVNHYRLNGGASSCHWIVEQDPAFFKSVYSAVLRGLCTIKRLDICADHSTDLMPFLSEDIKLGCVNGFGSHLRGSGVSDGKPFHNKSIGFRSASGKKLRGFPDFRINSLHCGESRTSSCVAVFYNNSAPEPSREIVEKRKQEDGTRIKVSLFPRAYEPEYVDLANVLFYTLTLPRSSNRGRHVRRFIFTCLLFSRIVFTRRERSKSRPFSSLATWSPWYCKLAQACIAYCMQPPESASTVSSQAFGGESTSGFPYKERDMLELFENFRANSRPIIDFCEHLLHWRGEKSH